MDDEILSLAWLDMLAALGVAFFIALIPGLLMLMWRDGSQWRERRHGFRQRRRGGRR